MSPLWRDELRISLAPGRIGVERVRRGWKPQVYSCHELECGAALPGEALWSQAVQTLDTHLQEDGNIKANIAVTLSGHFVRFTLVPWSSQISSPQEEQSFIRLCFTRIYGDEAASWAFRLSPGGYGETRVACAIDPKLEERLASIAQAHGAQLVSLQPHFVSIFNRWRRHITRRSAWFVVVEPGRLSMALLEQGQWRSLRSVKVGPDWCEALCRLLERELLVSEVMPERGMVYLSSPQQDQSIELPGWNVQCLDNQPRPATGAGIQPAFSLSE